MIVLDYYPLDLNISKGSESSPNQYHASIMENGVIAAAHDFELRQDLKLSQMLESIEKKATTPKPLPEETTHIEFGKMLYHTVFSGELGDYFNKRFIEAQDNDHGFRISLRFADNIPEIAALPWEYLHNGEDFLVARKSILLSRLPPNVKKTEVKPLDSILRMLVIISGPDDPRVSPLNTEKEQEIILEAVDKLQREQKIKVDFTEDATFENVQGYLNEQQYHIVHFTGHGISINGKGHLVFETENRKARLIDNRTLSNLFSDRGIRLVVLSSCESAKGSNKEALGDLASMLSKRRIPAVVAMQYSVLDDVAIKFADTFYKTIASGKSVDLALKEARIMMRNSEKSNGMDFATPVLYLSDYNCVRVEDIKPEPSEFLNKLNKKMMLPDLQVMKKGFVARKKELLLLEKSFKSDVKRAAIIHGFGGMGKTVLATRFALKMNEYFDGIFGMKCTPTTRPEDILTKINSFLMMNGRFELNQVLNQQDPLEVKTSVLINILNQLRFLIILDNFEDCLDEDRKDIESPELKAFLQQLLNNTYTGTKFIITTRYDFDPLEGRLPESIEHISLPELHFPQTNWLMNNYTELADLDIQKKKQIYNVIGGHPLTIGWFAKHAVVQGVDDLLLDLQSLKKELIEFTLLDKSYSKLDKDAKELLLSASIYEEAVPVEALSWIVGNEKDESPSVGEPLNKLIQWGLISKEQEYDKNVYSEHTIVKDFARKKLEKDGLDKKELLIRAARYYENIGSQTGIWSYLKSRDYYFRAKDWENAHNIVESTLQYLVLWGHIELAMNLLNESISTVSDMKKIDAEYEIAKIFSFIGDYNRASQVFNDVENKYTSLGNRRGIAKTLYELGVIHQYQCNYEEAVKLYNQSLEISGELGDKDITSITLHALGIFYCDQGDYKKALDLYNQTLELKEELKDIRGIAVSLHELGMIHQEQGNYEEAVKLYNQSLEIKEEIGDKKGISITLYQLGIIHLEQGNYEEAINRYNKSLNIDKELGDKSGVAKILHELGNVHFSQENYEEAVKLYNQSLKIKKELGNKRGATITLRQLGMIHQVQGNYEEALEKYNQALKTFDELGDRKGIADSMRGIGNIYYICNYREEAMDLYRQTFNINVEIGDKYGSAVTLVQMGRIHEGREEYEFAFMAYSTAFEIFDILGSPYRELTQKDIERLEGKMGEKKGKKRKKWWKIF